MKNELKFLLTIIILLITFVGCEDDDIVNISGGGKHKILITIAVGQSSYVGTIKDLTVSNMTNEHSYEHVEKVATFVYKDMVFVAEHWMGDVLHKYVRTGDGVLNPAGSITLPAGGQGQCLAFKDDTKAYLGLTAHGTIYVFNPTTLEHIKTIDLTAYAVGDNDPDPTALIVRNDGKLFVCLNQLQTAYTSFDSGYVAVINTLNDEVEKVIVDERVTGLGGAYNRSILIDEKNDIYLYSMGDCGYQPGAKDGILKIKSGETDFDKSYYFSPKSQIVAGIEGGSVLYGMGLCYSGGGKAFSMMLVPALTSNPPDYENDKNAQAVIVDLYNKSISKIDLPPTSMYASVGVIKLDNKIVFGMSTLKGDGLYTYDLNTQEVSANPVVTTLGKPQFMGVFED